MPRIPIHLIDLDEHASPIPLGRLMRDGTRRNVMVRPIVVTREGGRYRLLRGKRRLMVAQCAGDTDIEAEIRTRKPDAG